MKSTPRTSPAPLLNGATASAAILAVAIFVVDVTTPLGNGIAALYALPLLVGTINEPPRFQLVAAAVASALTAAGAWVPRPGLAFGYIVINRSIALILIWATAIVLARFRATWRIPKTTVVPKYTLAILHDPSETLPPSSPPTLQKFARVRAQTGENDGDQAAQSLQHPAVRPAQNHTLLYSYHQRPFSILCPGAEEKLLIIVCFLPAFPSQRGILYQS